MVGALAVLAQAAGPGTSSGSTAPVPSACEALKDIHHVIPNSLDRGQSRKREFSSIPTGKDTSAASFVVESELRIQYTSTCLKNSERHRF